MERTTSSVPASRNLDCAFDFGHSDTPTSSNGSEGSILQDQSQPAACELTSQLTPQKFLPFSLCSSVPDAVDAFCDLLSPRVSCPSAPAVDTKYSTSISSSMINPASSSTDLLSLDLTSQFSSVGGQYLQGQASLVSEAEDPIERVLDMASTLASSRSTAGSSWWETLEVLLWMPEDVGYSVFRRIQQAMRAAEHDGAEPMVLLRLRECLAQRSASEMKELALKVYREFKPSDLEDNLRRVLNVPPASYKVATLAVSAPSTRAPQGSRVHKLMNGTADFEKKVASISHRPWFELVEEGISLKSNNGYPVLCHIVAAIRSAMNHPVYRSNEVALRLKDSLTVYCRKSCGETKNRARKVLSLK